MKILLDTHALYWFFVSDKRLSNQARLSISQASQIFIPIIVLLELFYLLQKKKEINDFMSVFEEIKNNEAFTLVSLDLATLETVLKLPPKLEMHDRIIVATAQLLNAPIITKDSFIQKVYKNTIW